MRLESTGNIGIIKIKIGSMNRNYEIAAAHVLLHLYCFLPLAAIHVSVHGLARYALRKYRYEHLRMGNGIVNLVDKARTSEQVVAVVPHREALIAEVIV